MLHQGALKASAGIKRTDKKKEESKVFMSVDTSRIESDKVKTNDSFTQRTPDTGIQVYSPRSIRRVKKQESMRNQLLQD